MEECTNADTLVQRPPINEGSSRACATEQRGNNEEHFTGNTNHQIPCTGTLILCQVECSLLMYAEKQALYIFIACSANLSNVCGGETCNVSIKHGVRDICHRTVCCCDLQRFQLRRQKKYRVAGLSQSVSSLDTAPIQNNCDH